MKKRNVIYVLLMLLIAVAPMQLKAGTETNKTDDKAESAMESARATELMKRLDEINTLDKSAMSPKEKKETRKEVRAINKELKQLGGGVYISVGAIIIILLILILLL